jgi:hypothetical protein
LRKFLVQFELLADLDPVVAEDRLHELREELRHIIYHVNDSL